MVSAALLYVPGAWLFFGTYPVPFKSPAIVKADTDPFILQCFKSTCVFLTSWITLLWNPFSFTPLGFVGAACWVPAGLTYITAVKLCGLAYVSPVATGFQVVVAYCWGRFYFNESVKNNWLTMLAMFIMFIGMVMISYATNYEKLQKQKEKKRALTINIRSDVDEEAPVYKDVVDETTPLTSSPTKGKDGQKDNEMRNMVYGLLLALAAGVTGGSMNVPLKKAHNAHGIQYVISFGIGAVAITALLTLIYIIIRLSAGRGPPKVNMRVSFIPASIAGLLWSAGNICSIYTTLNYGVMLGTPLVQCNMMIVGCWGVFYYGEAPRLSMKLLFIASCVVLMGGVALLSYYG